ncbi:MAG TPA: zinc-binding dehydrogenase [Steroidobacteraceae bacterium]|nr:zinc-binding dehydrogenase [Steroidobacteraceae bacterium]
MTILRHAWRTSRAGSLRRLRCVEEPVAPPGPGEARLRIEAVGVNFADIFACLGLYSATPDGSFVPGLECTGVIEALGAGSEGQRWRVGDRVIALTRFGAYATALNADLDFLLPVPEGWTLPQAAAYPVQALTAWYGLVELGAIGPGDAVLVHSAAGGVGLRALELVAALGARPVAIVGSEHKRRFLLSERGFAAETVVLRGGRRFGERLDLALAALGADGFDCVFDAVLGSAFRPGLERLGPAGRYVLYGAADFMSRGARPNLPRLAWHWLRRPRLDPLAMIPANLSLMAFNLIWLWDEVDRLAAAWPAVRRLIPGPPAPVLPLPFSDAPEALRRMQRGDTIGKLVLTTGQ